MAWLFSFVLMAIQKGQDSPPPGRQLQAVLLWYFIFILFLIITKVLSRARRPWDRQALGAVRKSADDVLCTEKVPIQHEDHHIF